MLMLEYYKTESVSLPSVGNRFNHNPVPLGALPAFVPPLLGTIALVGRANKAAVAGTTARADGQCLNEVNRGGAPNVSHVSRSASSTATTLIRHARHRHLSARRNRKMAGTLPGSTMTVMVYLVMAPPSPIRHEAPNCIDAHHWCHRCHRCSLPGSGHLCHLWWVVVIYGGQSPVPNRTLPEALVLLMDVQFLG